MNNQRLNKSYNLEDYFAELQTSIAASKIHCHRIASVVNFNPGTQRATVQLVDYITIPTDSTTNQFIPALISNVPVHINSTLLGGFTIPINPGDFCLLEFNDRDLTNWLLSGNLSATELASNRTHSFTDAIAIVGIFPNPQPLAIYNNAATEMFYGANSRISVQENSVNITNGVSTVAVGAKVNINNSAGALGVLLGQLIDIISGLSTTPTVPGSPATLDPGVITALNNIKGTIQDLLE